MAEKPTYEELEQRVKKLEKEAVKGAVAGKEWEAFFESSTDLLCTIGFDRRFKRVNGTWQKILGWSEEELKNQLYTDYVHPEDSAEAESTGEDRKKTGEPVEGFQNRFRGKDGSYRWLSWSAMPLLDKQLTIAVARDITERKQAEEEIRIANEMRTNLLDNIVGCIALILKKGSREIIASNKQAHDVGAIPGHPFQGSTFIFFSSQAV